VTASRGARGKARKRALDVLYEADLRGIDPVTTVADRLAQADPPVPEYTVELVEGVTARRARIDELIATYSEGWTLERMPPVDRNLLRVAIYELLWNDDVPDAVAISEAVELAKDLSTDESPRFVNGLLGRLQLLKAELVG
jgi:transcription antitermination protein NusB